MEKIIGSILLIFAFSIMWLSPYYGHYINFDQDAWYAFPYIFTSITNFDFKNCIKTYTVQTAIHDLDWDGMSKECIYLKYEWDVMEEQLDSVSKAEYEKAERFIKKVKDCFEDDF